MYLDKDVAVQYHEVVGHLSWDFDIILLQFLIHAEQHIMGVAVVAYREHLE